MTTQQTGYDSFVPERSLCFPEPPDWSSVGPVQTYARVLRILLRIFFCSLSSIPSSWRLQRCCRPRVLCSNLCNCPGHSLFASPVYLTSCTPEEPRLEDTHSPLVEAFPRHRRTYLRWRCPPTLPSLHAGHKPLQRWLLPPDSLETSTYHP